MMQIFGLVLAETACFRRFFSNKASRFCRAEQTVKPRNAGLETKLLPRKGETSKPRADYQCHGCALWNPEDHWSPFDRQNLPRPSALYPTLGLERTKAQEC